MQVSDMAEVHPSGTHLHRGDGVEVDRGHQHAQTGESFLPRHAQGDEEPVPVQQPDEQTGPWVGPGIVAMDRDARRYDARTSALERLPQPLGAVLPPLRTRPLHHVAGRRQLVDLRSVPTLQRGKNRGQFGAIHHHEVIQLQGLYQPIMEVPSGGIIEESGGIDHQPLEPEPVGTAGQARDT